MAEHKFANTKVFVGKDLEDGSRVVVVDNGPGYYGCEISITNLFGETVTATIDTRILLGVMNQLKKFNKGRNRAFVPQKNDYCEIATYEHEEWTIMECERKGDWVYDLEEELPPIGAGVACHIVCGGSDSEDEDVKRMLFRDGDEESWEWRYGGTGELLEPELVVIAWCKQP